MKFSTIFNAIDLFVELHPFWTLLIFLFIASMLLLVHYVKNAVPLDECQCGEQFESGYFDRGNKCPYCGTQNLSNLK